MPAPSRTGPGKEKPQETHTAKGEVLNWGRKGVPWKWASGLGRVPVPPRAAPEGTPHFKFSWANSPCHPNAQAQLPSCPGRAPPRSKGSTGAAVPAATNLISFHKWASSAPFHRVTSAPRAGLGLHPAFQCLPQRQWRRGKRGKPTFLEKRMWVESPASSTGAQCRRTSLS